MFSKFGEILDSKLIVDKGGNFKGTALVNFKEAQAAQECIRQLNGNRLDDGSIVFISKHLSKKELMH